MNNDINAVDRLKIRSPIIIDRQVDYNPQEMSDGFTNQWLTSKLKMKNKIKKEDEYNDYINSNYINDNEADLISKKDSL